MRLHNLLEDDDAVSPVIGVILMVAITVILAAVIASFVLGLGNQAGTTSPQASLSVDYESASSSVWGTTSWNGNITVSHDSGDSIVAENLYLRGENFVTPGEDWGDYDTSTTENISKSTSGSVEGQDAVVAGDRLRIGANSTYELSVVWESAEGDSSNTFREDTGPDA
jgi:flagellin-like protein